MDDDLIFINYQEKIENHKIDKDDENSDICSAWNLKILENIFNTLINHFNNIFIY